MRIYAFHWKCRNEEKQIPRERKFWKLFRIYFVLRLDFVCSFSHVRNVEGRGCAIFFRSRDEECVKF